MLILRYSGWLWG